MNIKKTAAILTMSAAFILPASDSICEISKQKKQEIADKLYNIELSGGDYLGYTSEILQHLEKSSGIRPQKYKSDPFDDVDRLNLRGNSINLYSLLSGGLAIRESLLLESIRPVDDNIRDVNPSSITPVSIESHPYEKMLKNRDYKTYPVDKCVPDDFYYMHFNYGSKAIDFINFLNETGSAVYKRFSPVSVDYMVKDKLMVQLAMRESQDMAAFYSGAITEIAITGSDPFFIEGSDVTIIIRPASPQIVYQAIGGMRRYIKERYSATEREILVCGIKGSHIFTGDRRVWSFFFTLPDGTAVVSNSAKAVERVIDTFSGKLTSIADSWDYRYMRSIYPAGRDNEDGFIYLSDRFIRYLVSPALKIKEARRMYEAMKAAVLEKYMIYHYQATGKVPSSIEEVMDSAGGSSFTDARKKELESLKRNSFYGKAIKLEQADISTWDSFRAALVPPDVKKPGKKRKKSPGPDDFIYDLKMFYRKITGDQAFTPVEVLGIIDAVSKPGALESKRFKGISITPGSFSARSDYYGKTGYMLPLIETETGAVSRREAEEYRKFADTYTGFRRDVFDPVGIRIKTDPGISIETCILPLTDNPVYSLLAGIAGGKPVELHPDSKIRGDTLSIAFKVNQLAINSYLALSGIDSASLLKSAPGQNEIFTGEIQLHMGDALPLADFNPAIIAEFSAGNIIRSSEVITGLLVWSLSHPVRIALPVNRPREGMNIINTLIDKIIERSSFSNYIQSESYLFTYNRNDIRVLKLTLFNSLITRIYLAEKDNVIHIATTEKYMKEILDINPSAKSGSIKKNAALVYRPSEMLLEKETYRAGMIESGLSKSRRNSGTIKLLGMMYPDADSKELPDIAYRNFGFKPVCPLGGEYTYDRRSGEVGNTVYGNWYYPVLRMDESSNGSVPLYLKRFFKTSELRFEFEFTPEGIRTKIVSR